jgi:Zn-dependent protease
VFLFALSVHEAAHAWMSAQCGDLYATHQGRLTLNPASHIDPIGTVLIPLMPILFSASIPFIGWARPVPVIEGNLRRARDFVWIALAGPASNLILALWGIVTLKIIFIFLSPTWPAIGYPIQVFGKIYEPDLLIYFIQINLFLAVFNMIPVPPLDGSRLFYHVFVSGKPSMQPVWNAMEQYGFMVLLILVVTGMFGRIIGPFIGWMGSQVINLVV